MVRTVFAEHDASLVARVVSRRPLYYREGPDANEDRPAYVRSGSGLSFWEGRLAVVQDDASFIAFVDLTTGLVDSVALPRGPGGARQFDDDRGNKSDKLDLESCVVLSHCGEEWLVAFGSGSTDARERVALVRAPRRGSPVVEVVGAPALYAALRSATLFSGGELNIEGAAVCGESLWLAQRGNGRVHHGRVPPNAIVRLSLKDVLDILKDGGSRPLRLRELVEYELGALDGVRFTFTDITAGPSSRIAYLAAAEASPDATHDGPVLGTALGVIEGNSARFTPLIDSAGALFREKAEGLALDPFDPHRTFVVVDADDPRRPSELCEVELDGQWWGSLSAAP